MRQTTAVAGRASSQSPQPKKDGADAASPPARAPRKTKGASGDAGVEAHNSTVDRALRVLEAFLREESELGVLELSRQLDLDKSVIHRILATLVGRRFLEQDPTTRRYRVGLRVWELGQRYMSGQILRETAERELTQMIRQHPYATAYLAELDHGDVVVLSTIRGPGPLNLYMDPGTRISAELTVTGRAMLASLPWLQAERAILKRRQHGKSIRVPPALEELEREFATIRERGYSARDSNYSPGIGTVAVAVHNTAGEPIAAISVDYIVGPETETLLEILPGELQECARHIEHVVNSARA